MGCVHIYCGDGKGKTTAATGLALRMAGSGGQVIIARFLKNDTSGEVGILREIKGIYVFPSEKIFGFTWRMSKEQMLEAEEYYEELLSKAFQMAYALADGSRPVLLILDEICGAVNSGLLKESQLFSLMEGQRENMEIVMTGREPSDMMLERADYVSEIKKIKHPFDSGMAARKGIEY